MTNSKNRLTAHQIKGIVITKEDCLMIKSNIDNLVDAARAAGEDNNRPAQEYFINIATEYTLLFKKLSQIEGIEIEVPE